MVVKVVKVIEEAVVCLSEAGDGVYGLCLKVNMKKGRDRSCGKKRGNI